MLVGDNKYNKMNLNNFIISIIEDIPNCKNVIEFCDEKKKFQGTNPASKWN